MSQCSFLTPCVFLASRRENPAWGVCLNFWGRCLWFPVFFLNCSSLPIVYFHVKRKEDEVHSFFGDNGKGFYIILPAVECPFNTTPLSLTTVIKYRNSENQKFFFKLAAYLFSGKTWLELIWHYLESIYLT